MESNTVYSLTPKFQRLKDQTQEAVRDFLRKRYEERVAKSGAARCGTHIAPTSSTKW